LLLDYVYGQCYLTGMSPLLVEEPLAILEDPAFETLGPCLLFMVLILPLLKRNVWLQVLAAKRVSNTSVFIDDPLIGQHAARK
jgi:hypothetical protein